MIAGYCCSTNISSTSSVQISAWKSPGSEAYCWPNPETKQWGPWAALFRMLGKMNISISLLAFNKIKLHAFSLSRGNNTGQVILKEEQDPGLSNKGIPKYCWNSPKLLSRAMLRSRTIQLSGRDPLGHFISCSPEHTLCGIKTPAWDSSAECCLAHRCTTKAFHSQRWSFPTLTLRGWRKRCFHIHLITLEIVAALQKSLALNLKSFQKGGNRNMKLYKGNGKPSRTEAACLEIWVSSLVNTELMVKTRLILWLLGPPGPAAVPHHWNQPQATTQPAFAWGRSKKKSWWRGHRSTANIHRLRTRDPENSWHWFSYRRSAWPFEKHLPSHPSSSSSWNPSLLFLEKNRNRSISLFSVSQTHQRMHICSYLEEETEFPLKFTTTTLLVRCRSGSISDKTWIRNHLHC